MSYLDPAAETVFFARQKEMARRLNCDLAPCIVDVGGNVGQSIEAYRGMFPGSSMYTIEPLPDCFETLKKQYGASKGIVLDQLALAESAGTRQFHATKCRAASSLLPPDEAVRKKSAKGNYEYDLISVTVDTLDAYCSRKKITMIDILKIDVQGAELGVLRGAQKILAENQIRLMYLEVIFADNYQGQSSLVPIAAFLEKFGYVLWDVRPFLFTRAGRLWTANALFTSGPSAEILEKYPEEFPN